jgi:hypothetical protein
MSKFDQIDWVSRFIVLVINVLFSLLMTSAGKFLFEYLQKMIKLKEIENKQLQSELNILKSQVNPHFLFNTLNNLYGLITQNENQKAAEITLKLAELTRYLLESSKTEKISIKRELQFIEDYLCLEKIRFSNNTDINHVNRELTKAFNDAKNIIDPDGSINHTKITQSEIFSGDEISLPNFERFVQKNPEYKGVFDDWKKLFDKQIELSLVGPNAFRSSVPYSAFKELYNFLINLRKNKNQKGY